MRILHICSRPFSSTYGGLEIYLRTVLPLQAEAGNDVWVLSIFEDKDISSVSIRTLPLDRGVSVKELHLPTRDKFASEGTYQTMLTDALTDELRWIRPDICHCHHGYAAECIQICKALEIPVLYTIHCVELFCITGTLLNFSGDPCDGVFSCTKCLKCCGSFLPFRRFFNLVVRLMPTKIRFYLEKRIDFWPFIYFLTPLLQQTALLRRMQKNLTSYSEADALIAPSRAIAELVHQNLKSNNVIELNHGIDSSNTECIKDIQDCSIEFFYLGRICEYKGIHVMLDAFAKLSHQNWKLHIYGEPVTKWEKRYKRTLQNTYSSLPVIWHGKIPHEQLNEQLEGHHIMIHPALCFEIYGLTIAEAQSMGKPVLTTACGGPESQIQHGVNGWIVPKNDVSSMKMQLEEILEHPEIILDMSKRCHTTDIGTHLSRLYTIYQSLVVRGERIS